MKIGIISDTHDKIDYLKLVLAYFNKNKIEALIHAGDLSHSSTLDVLGKKFHGKVYIAEGNSDLDVEEIKKVAKIYGFEYKDVIYLPPYHLQPSIAITHKNTDALKLAKSGKYDLVIHGHTHKPWQRFIGKTEVLNPGNLCDQRFDAAFAVYDTDTRKAQLMIVSKIKNV